MNEQATARYYGRMLGILSGLFALLQVLVSVSAVLANQGAIAALQHSASPPYLGTIPSDLNGVVIVLVATYGSALLGGLLMIGFAWYAGRLTALSLDRRVAGGTAGFWVALWSGVIWLIVSLVAALLTHADGTVSGVFTSSPGRALSVVQVVLLLVQNGVAALIGLGLGSLAGLIGTRSVRVSPDTQPRFPVVTPPAVYPQQAYPPGAYPPNPNPSPYPTGAGNPQAQYPPLNPSGSYPQGMPPQVAYPPEPMVPSRPDPMRYPAYSSSPTIPSPLAPPPTQPLSRRPSQPATPPNGTPTAPGEYQWQPPPDSLPEQGATPGTQEHVPPS